MECKSSPEKSVSNDALTFEMFLCSWKALGCHPDHNHRVSNVAQERNPLVTKIKSFSQVKTESIFFQPHRGLGPLNSRCQKVFQMKSKSSRKLEVKMRLQQVLNQKLMRLPKKVGISKSSYMGIFSWWFIYFSVQVGIALTKGNKVSTVSKKGTVASKGIEHDAMGLKWNKTMWDNMESKFILAEFIYDFCHRGWVIFDFSFDPK